MAANIFPNALIELAPDLATLYDVAASSSPAASLSRAEEAANAVWAAGFGLEERRSQGDWVRMVFRKP